MDVPPTLSKHLLLMTEFAWTAISRCWNRSYLLQGGLYVIWISLSLFFLSLSNDVLWINTPVGDVLGRSSAAVNAGEIPPPTRPGIKLQKQLLDIKILLKHQRFTNCEYTTHARQEAFKHSILSLRLHVSSSPASYEAPLNFTNYALLSGFQPQTTT